jgi:predicted RNase H-like HicB family nuclease
MNEIIFEVSQESDGGFVAECLTEGIFTQADNWEDLRGNVKEAVAAYYFDHPKQPGAALERGNPLSLRHELHWT